MSSTTMPPAARSVSTVTPKSASRKGPAQVTTSNVTAIATAHVRAVCLDSAVDRPLVIPAKTPVFPIGFIIENSAATKLATAASGVMVSDLRERAQRPFVSSHCARRHRLRDFLITHTEDLLQHLERMLPDAGRGLEWAVSIAGNLVGVTLVRHLTHLRMLQSAEEAPVLELRILHVITRALHHARWNTIHLQQVHQLARCVPLGEFGELAVDAISRRESAGQVRERRILCPRRLAQHLHQRAPLFIRLHRDRAPLILADA